MKRTRMSYQDKILANYMVEFIKRGETPDEIKELWFSVAKTDKERAEAEKRFEKVYNYVKTKLHTESVT